MRHHNQQQKSQTSSQLVTLPLHKSQQPIRSKPSHNICYDDKDNHNQSIQDHDMFSQSSQQSSERVDSDYGGQDGQKQNEELIKELCDLVGRQNVRGRIGKELYQRVERVLSAVENTGFKQAQSNPSCRSALKQLSNMQNSNQNKHKMTKGSLIHQKLLETDSKSQDQNQSLSKKFTNFCPVNTFSITRELLPQGHKNKNEHFDNIDKSNSKEKKAFQSDTHHSLKQTKSAKQLVQSTTNQKKLRTPSKKTDSKPTNSSKQKVYKFVLDKKRITAKPQQKSTDKKIQGITRNPSALSITAFTTRNKLNSKEKEKEKDKEKERGRTNSKGSSFNNSKQSTGKLCKSNSNSTKLKITKNDSLRRICTQQDYERMMMTEEEQDEKLFTNKQQRVKTYQSDSVPAGELMQNIAFLQSTKNKEQQQLESRIKSLRQQIASQAMLMNSLEQSISTIKKQQHNFDINNTYLLNKKKEVHKKLETVWNEVKVLNASIVGIRDSNQQILASLAEERQLVEMYNKVIDEIKQQLKIEIEEKDELKRLLKQSKKNEQASRQKAHTTKQKTGLILENVRQSINKWVI